MAEPSAFGVSEGRRTGTSEDAGVTDASDAGGVSPLKAVVLIPGVCEGLPAGLFAEQATNDMTHMLINIDGRSFIFFYST